MAHTGVAVPLLGLPQEHAGDGGAAGTGVERIGRLGTTPRLSQAVRVSDAHREPHRFRAVTRARKQLLQSSNLPGYLALKNSPAQVETRGSRPPKSVAGLGIKAALVSAPLCPICPRWRESQALSTGLRGVELWAWGGSPCRSTGQAMLLEMYYMDIGSESVG